MRIQVFTSTITKERIICVQECIELTENNSIRLNKQETSSWIKEQRAKIELALEQLKDIEKMSEEL